MDVKVQQALALRREVAQVVDELVTAEKFDENSARLLCERLDKNTIQDVVEERALGGVCGYILCDNKVQKRWKQKLVIRQNRLYDVTNRQYFCSDNCYVASNHLSDQLPEEPIWMLMKRKPLEIHFLPISEIKGKPGEEVQLRPTGVLETLRQLELLDNDENQLSRSLCHEELRKNLIEEIPSSIDVANSSQQDVELMSILSEREMSLADESDSELELIEDEGGETDSLSGFRFKSARKKLPQQSEMEMASKEEIRHLALESIREKYFTKDQNCRLSLKKSALKIVEVAPLPPGGLLRIHSDNKTNSNRRIFPCARALHVFENWVTPKTIEVLEHSSTEVEEISTRSQKDPKVAKMELMVKRFFQGEILQEQSDTDDESNKEVILPLVDSCDQRVERRNIVLDRMNVVWPSLLPQLSISFGTVGNHLRLLVDSFNLTADNISLQPVEWRVAAVCTLAMLSKANAIAIGDVLYSDQSKLNINSFLVKTDVHCDLIYDTVEKISSEFLNKYIYTPMGRTRDVLAGYGLVAFSLLLFVYYTLWAMILPFFDDDHFIHNYFPHRKWAIILPCLLILMGIGCLGIFVAMVLWRERMVEREAAKGKAGTRKEK